jgi:hypothetical protein
MAQIIHRLATYTIHGLAKRWFYILNPNSFTKWWLCILNPKSIHHWANLTPFYHKLIHSQYPNENGEGLNQRCKFWNKQTGATRRWRCWSLKRPTTRPWREGGGGAQARGGQLRDRGEETMVLVVLKLEETVCCRRGRGGEKLEEAGASVIGGRESGAGSQRREQLAGSQNIWKKSTRVGKYI